MARKPPEKPAPKGKGAKSRKGEEPDLSRGRAVAPPPAGLDVMPRPFLVDDVRADGEVGEVLADAGADRIQVTSADGAVAEGAEEEGEGGEG